MGARKNAFEIAREKRASLAFIGQVSTTGGRTRPSPRMHKPAPETPNRSFSSTPARRRRDRPATGIGVPTTLWLPPRDNTPQDPRSAPAVLPSWALRRVITEYATPDQSVVAVDSRGFRNDNRILAYQPLPACHDPHAETRPRPRRGAVHLAVLEIHTSAEEAPDPRPLDLLYDFVSPALRAGACHLAPGAVLAIALSAPEPGCPAACTSRVLNLAAEHGFAFQQHVVVVTADISGDWLIPRFTNAQATAANAARMRGIPAPAPAHLDLVIATLTAKEPRV